MSQVTTRHPHNKNYLYLGLGFLLSIILLVIFLSPDKWINLFLFYILLSLTIFYLGRFIFNQRKRAITVTSGIILLFLLRHLGLKSLLYPFLIFALILSLEVKVKNT